MTIVAVLVETAKPYLNCVIFDLHNGTFPFNSLLGHSVFGCH